MNKYTCSYEIYLTYIIKYTTLKLWSGNLCNFSYFVATVSENTEEQIREYIQSQKRK